MSVNHYRESFPDLCYTDIILNPTDSIHCIYGIDFNIAGNDQINYIRKDTIPLHFGAEPELIYNYCSPYMNCLPPASETSFIQRKVKLRGKDDEIICEIPLI